MVGEEFAGKVNVDADIVSCHRHPEKTRRLAKSCRIRKYDLVIAAGSKAFALAGVLDAWLYYYKQDVCVAAVALGSPGSKSLLAAELSIEEIPGQPVILDENGKAYSGQAGLRAILERVAHGELPPAAPREEKPAGKNVWKNY
jgi:phosphoribosylcarboxyaminoimidazole (NCAIR) mutase